MKRRILSAMLTLCMVLSLFPGTAWAAEEIRGETSDKSTASETTSDAGIMPLADTLTYGDLFYVVNDDTIEITDCNIEATSVDIPEQINGCTVTSIGPEAFNICRNLTNVTIPNSVKSIGRGAFLNCNSLSSITIPDSVTSLGDGMFFQCNSLTSVTIPQGITSIGSLMFYGCSSLTDVIIPNSVTDIGNDAFYGCTELVNITIPYGVTRIHGTAFSNSGLTSVTIPDSVTYIGNRAFGDCNRLTHVIIPNSVTSIQSAFQGCSKLVSAGPIGGGYSCEFGWSDEIPNSAFSNCNSLTDVIIPSGITYIGQFAFAYCSNLTSVTIPSSVTSIGGWAFDNSRLTDVFYGGSKDEWMAVKIGEYNDSLLSATIHYTGSGENPDPGPDIPSIPDTDMSIKKVNLPFNGHSVSANWGWNMFNQSAVKNQVWDIFDDNNLAIAGLALSRAAEDSQQQVESILGSENYLGFKAIRSKNYASTANQHPAVTFASKPILQNGKGEYVVAIVVRGTQPGNWDDYWTDISSLWGGFSTAADNLQIQLNEFLVDNCSAGIQNLRGKVKFFVTGHSLGAAVANVMAKNLSNEYGADNVFAYTFASPTTIQSAQSAGNIFNILNIEDGVTKLPGLYDHRHGWEVYFHRDLSAEDGFYNRFKDLTGRDFNKDSAHDITFEKNTRKKGKSMVP